MTAITIGHVTATIPASQAKVARSVKPQPGVFARVWNAFIRARMHQAERELARYRYLMPVELQDARREKDS